MTTITRPDPRRVLFLAPFPPRLDGTHGGSKVIAQLVTGFARRHDVGLLHLQGRDDAEPDDAIREACSFVEAVERPHKGGPLARKARIAAWLATQRPVWVAEWWTPEFATRLRAIAGSWQPDLVQIEFHVMAQYVETLRHYRAPCVLTEHESGVLAVLDERRYRRGLTGIALAFDLRAWRRYESRILAQVDSVAIFSERDREVLLTLARPRLLSRIPLGVIMPPAPCEVPADGSNVVFVGNFRHRPNVDAAMRLARDIHPRIRAHHPDARLYIVGQGPPRRLVALAQDDVVVTGTVADVTPYLERAAVVAAPLRFGGGVRVKVLEAMAAGKAVVASPLAAAEVAGEHLVLAETDDEVADAIVDLLRKPQRRAALGLAARQWVAEHASVERMVDALESIHDSLLAQRAAVEG
jgi:polysaccharide biosynthesis protein PslH